MQMSSTKKVVAIAITTVALTAGSFGVATAASKTTKVTRTSVSTIASQAASGKLGRGQELATLLSGLVSKGTITQAQADAIIAAVTSAEAARDALRPQMSPMGDKGGPLVDKLNIVASTLGVDTTTVLNRLKAGDSLATIAGAKKDALIAALVADETKQIDAAVTAGKLTAAQATELKKNLVAHVTAEVNATLPVGGPANGPFGGGDRGGKGGRGHGGPMGGGMMGGAAPTIPTPSTTTSSKA
jgi:polyhydroxyalkanoate synthesis regulator phasin